MKSYMLALAAVCFSFSLSAQNKLEIEKAEKLIQDGLPKDAATLLKKEISTMPCADDMALYVKANILYVSALSQYEEDAITLSINHLNEALPKCKAPATQIFHSYLGELYMQYGGYGGAGRKNLETPDDDISVWSSERIKEQAFHHFRASLQEPQQLFAIPITDYAVLLTKGKYDETYRPTLYDMMAHRFFNSLTEKPLRTEYPALIGTLPDFLQMKADNDASIKTFAIATWQQLLQLHEADADPTALIQADLDRINFFAPSNTVMDAYDYLLQKYDAYPAVALVAFQKAQLLNNQGMMINVRKANATEKRSRVEAADICKQYSRKFPDSDGGKNCASLLITIIKQEVTSLNVEPVVLPSQPALACVEFRNLQRLTCMIYAVPTDKTHLFSEWNKENEIKKFLSDNRPVKQWEIEIPDPQDYLTHTMEFGITPIEKAGSYLLLITPEPVFSIEKSLFITQFFQVSALCPIYTQTTGKTGSFTITDRLTGLPLKGVSILVSNQNSPKTVIETLTTDDNGMAYLSKDYNASLRAVFAYKKDSLFQSLWNSRQSSQERKNYTSTLLFTDRAVYRPGQTVYFKGIIIETSETKVVTVANTKADISLRDVNYQEILKLSHTSDDFGGFDGTFTIPANVLTGNMTLQTQNGTVSFLVEEYKRPRFEVTFDKINEVYALNEEVKVKGKAMMLNGLPLENATVNFQVSRRTFRPFHYGFYNYLPRFSPEQPIATGTATTKADGTFEITFKTVADVEDDGHKFYYTFNITADVTDITGEMQSGSANIAAGKKGLIINVEVPTVVTGKENDELKVSFKNYSGEVVPVSSATITIEELSQPKTAYINRLWAIPDLIIASEEDFAKKFPQYAYDSDSLPVAKRIYSSKIENTLKLSDKLTRSGKYRITVSAPDKAGEPTTEVKEFTFLKEGEKTFPIAQNALFHVDKKSVKVGEKVKIFAGSAAKNAKVFYTLITPAGVQKQQWMDVGKQPLWIEIATDAAMIPAFTVNMYIVQNNRIYEANEQITVTDPAKELTVEVTGIRDKTMPGAKERWEMKITDKDGKPAAATLFTTMYDAALDKFASLSWNFFASPNYRRASFNSMTLTSSAAFSNSRYNEIWNETGFITPAFPAFDWFGFYFYSSRFGRNMVEIEDNLYLDAKMSMPQHSMPAPSAKGQVAMMADRMDMDAEAIANDNATAPATSEPAPANNTRQNFAETVFFYPDMRTDKEGNIILEFVMPETLTRWNMQAIGYTNTLQIGNFSQSIVTESDFMVMPNLPRFLRVGDTCVLTTRIANRTDKPLSGKAKIVIENMATGVSLQENVISDIEIPFTVNGNESIAVSWKYRQTDSADALLVRMTATSGNFTDGEEHILAVLPSEIVLQETIAMEMTKAGTHTFTFENFDSAPQKLTVDMSTSPVWFAIQSLPTLAEYPHESADQIFNRYYSAALGSHILNSMPQIKRVFDQWRNFEPDALLSNLEKNQELKALLLAETPWVMEAQSETARKQRLATLFDVNNLTYSLRQAVSKLQQRQLSDGGFSWYPEMRSSVYITRYIVTGIGKLNTLKINNSDLNFIADRAIQYLDREWMRQYEETTRRGKYAASSYDIAYLYCRSFFMDKKFEEKQSQVLETVLKECIQKQKDFDFNTRAMLALTLQRSGKTADAQTIAKSLDNYSIGNAATGKYWRTQQGSGSASDIALSALMVEVYNEVLNNKDAANDVLTWLLRNKRTNDWTTPVATADAVYALVSSSPTSLEPAQVSLKIGSETITPVKEEAGTGYFQVVYNKGDIKPDMRTITVTSTQDKQVWGGAYLQYRSAIDKVKGDKNAPLAVTRDLFKRNGAQWERITDNTPLKVGDKVTVRLTIKANRDFDFVHIRDMRAASFEPVEQTSGYVWNHQLGYYRSVRDAVVNLFFDRMPRGTWTLEYELFVTQAGTFSNGYASIQCFYAPEFSGVSDGGKVRVE